MARLTTHVLDTARGQPACGMRIELYSGAGERRLLASTATDAATRPWAKAASFLRAFTSWCFMRGITSAALASLFPIRRFSIGCCCASVSPRPMGAITCHCCCRPGPTSPIEAPRQRRWPTVFASFSTAE
jgi:hypothetical protein